MHLVLPALYLSTPDASILIMVEQVRLMMLSLKMVDYSPLTALSTWIFFWQISKLSYSLGFKVKGGFWGQGLTID